MSHLVSAVFASESSSTTHDDDLLLALDSADNQLLVLGAEENLVQVKTAGGARAPKRVSMLLGNRLTAACHSQEGLGGILAGNLLVVENALTSWVLRKERSCCQ